MRTHLINMQINTPCVAHTASGEGGEDMGRREEMRIQQISSACHSTVCRLLHRVEAEGPTENKTVNLNMTSVMAALTVILKTGVYVEGRGLMVGREEE